MGLPDAHVTVKYHTPKSSVWGGWGGGERERVSLGTVHNGGSRASPPGLGRHCTHSLHACLVLAVTAGLRAEPALGGCEFFTAQCCNVRRLHRNTGAGAIGAYQVPDLENPKLFHVYITFSLDIQTHLKSGIIIPGIGVGRNEFDVAEDVVEDVVDDDSSELSDEED
jgi:hypothetical protein